MFEVPALPSADSLRITCPVVAGASSKAARSEESAEGPGAAGGEVGVYAIPSTEAFAEGMEEVTPTQEDRRALSRTT